MHHLVQHGVRALEAACCPDVIADVIGMDVFHRPRDLRIAETMIAEDGMPLYPTLATDVNVLGTGVTEIIQIERAVGIQLLGIFHADGIAWLARGRKSNPTSHVLMEIVDFGVYSCGFGGEGCHRHPRRHLGTQGS